MRIVFLGWLIPFALLAQQPTDDTASDGGRTVSVAVKDNSATASAANAAGDGERAPDAPDESMPEFYDSVVASVDGDPIILSEVVIESRAEEARLFATLTGKALEDAIVEQRRKVVDLLIDRRLLRKAFKPEEYTVPDQTIESVLDDWSLSLNCKTRLELERWARQNHTTLADMRKKVVDYLIEQYVMFRQFTIEVNVTPRDTYEYFQAHRQELSKPETVHLYALFLSSDRDDLAAITDKINGILAADSSQFRDLAGTYSDGPFRSRGGDLGWLERSQLRELFSDALKANPDAGSTIGPLTAPEGVYFIQAVEVKPAETATYEGSELDIRAKLELEQRKKVYDNYMKTLRDKAVIRYY
ncbi:MAG: peptidylprolyl isomerase [Victivallaceae bacterium]|nr:peptidylprolyl isomerase [Victivallaceae bacterium]